MYNFLLQADPVLSPVATDDITEVNVNVLELLMTGGWYIMLPLAMMSLIAMYVYFERFFAIKKAAAEPTAILIEIISEKLVETKSVNKIPIKMVLLLLLILSDKDGQILAHPHFQL